MNRITDDSVLLLLLLLLLLLSVIQHGCFRVTLFEHP
jgi:hypothetical protein